MEQFYKFEVVTTPLDVVDLDDLDFDESRENNVEYKLLPVRLSSIIIYHPLKVVNLNVDQEDLEYFDDDDIWEHANYINLILVDGSQMMIKHQIKDFEKILFGEEF